jgi:hypothetical protein
LRHFDWCRHRHRRRLAGRHPAAPTAGLSSLTRIRRVLLESDRRERVIRQSSPHRPVACRRRREEPNSVRRREAVRFAGRRLPNRCSHGHTFVAARRLFWARYRSTPVRGAGVPGARGPDHNHTVDLVVLQNVRGRFNGSVVS